MIYISTSGLHTATLRQATTNAIAPDGTLYLPESIPTIPKALFNNIEDMKLREIAYVVVSSLLGTDIDPAKLKQVVDSTFNFPMPVKQLRHGIEMLELFDGPTLAFKDVGARFLAEVFRMSGSDGATGAVALTATTGNTGAAVATAFSGLKDTPVAILFPRGALSRQEQAQLTTVSPNIHPIEVSGTISQCKQMVREAMSDDTLKSRFTPICVNSHNILRIIPQVVFFFYAYARLKKRYGQDADGFMVSVPCGCLSSLTAAIIAKRMGLPMGRIIAGCNANDDFVRVLSGELSPDKVNHASRPTLAKAMDTGFPTNLYRVLRLYNNDLAAARRDITAVSLSDEDIAATIVAEFSRSSYMCDPHTATALGAYLREKTLGNLTSAPVVVMATAHPAKSLDSMTAITGRAVELPLQLTRFMSKGVVPLKIPPTYPALRKFITSL